MRSSSLHSIDDLVGAGLVAEEERGAIEPVAARYAVALTPTVAALIDKFDPTDPIALQYIPRPEELKETPEERADPIGDHAHSPVEGIVHRYPDRVLLKAVHVCPVYCRFCFRREMVGPQGDGNLAPAALEKALDYIGAHPEIWEVILTGGDPLVLSPRRLREITKRLATMPHVKILRVHSRVPVVDPDRISAEMIEALKIGGKTVYVALHANHPREMTPAARQACTRLIDAGVVMVSQSVLLKGINDEPDVLADLMRAFVETRVKPYYLHHPDLAPGTSHFRLTIAEGQAILRALRSKVSGLCIPTYILDLPGGHGKVAVGDDSLKEIEPGRYAVLDRLGAERSYP
ncbi:lysine-2,3-aminomutase-like protein [Rhizobium sp. S-51]|uniref:Lysine-2,3-aminomutase-like protein n=1 Tax=Rhizobium terricola TaxID=2728849 RepID=A0A7Y0AZ29_9HYPH|nr:lysine-2,3-aminomutase-like protein [Rhizobium terricola]NML75965.1 lysine-2,3-aminomutase-like protein [Rhizobium terricola]